MECDAVALSCSSVGSVECAEIETRADMLTKLSSLAQKKSKVWDDCGWKLQHLRICES
jgi:hypothetical protein